MKTVLIISVDNQCLFQYVPITQTNHRFTISVNSTPIQILISHLLVLTVACIPQIHTDHLRPTK